MDFYQCNAAQGSLWLFSCSNKAMHIGWGTSLYFLSLSFHILLTRTTGSKRERIGRSRARRRTSQQGCSRIGSTNSSRRNRGFHGAPTQPQLTFQLSPNYWHNFTNVTGVGARVGVRGVNALYISPFWKADCTSTHQIRFSYFKFNS